MPLPVPSELLEPLTLSGRSSAISLWIHKTANIFRGVVELDCSSKTVSEVSSLIRDTVSAEYSPGLIVPFAFGSVLRYQSGSPDATAIEHLLDDRSRSKGTWQWIIVVDEESKQVHGVHMWAHGYLTPVYKGLIKYFENTGYNSTTITKPPGKLFTRLWAISAALITAHKALAIIGTIFVLAVLLIQFLIAA